MNILENIRFVLEGEETLRKVANVGRWAGGALIGGLVSNAVGKHTREDGNCET